MLPVTRITELLFIYIYSKSPKYICLYLIVILFSIINCLMKLLMCYITGDG